MRKLCIIFLILPILTLTACSNVNFDTQPKCYLRVHIRADSNLEKDQTVKYLVKDGIVNFLTPLLASASSKEQAESIISENLTKIEKVADDILLKNGFLYKSKAKLNNEYFPTRVYDNYTLISGYYDALILELGSGKGDNWWCVVYPPLCFVNENTSYVYKSKLLEIIDKFFN